MDKDLQDKFWKWAVFYFILTIAFIVLVVYFWYASGQPPYIREAGIALVSAFIGSALYGTFEKFFLDKKSQ